MGKIACMFNNRKSRIIKIIAITYLSPRILMGHKGSFFNSVKIVSYSSTNMAFSWSPYNQRFSNSCVGGKLVSSADSWALF